VIIHDEPTTDDDGAGAGPPDEKDGDDGPRKRRGAWSLKWHLRLSWMHRRRLRERLRLTTPKKPFQVRSPECITANLFIGFFPG
jgi:hypothetical protein